MKFTIPSWLKFWESTPASEDEVTSKTTIKDNSVVDKADLGQEERIVKASRLKTLLSRISEENECTHLKSLLASRYWKHLAGDGWQYLSTLNHRELGWLVIGLKVMDLDRDKLFTTTTDGLNEGVIDRVHICTFPKDLTLIIKGDHKWCCLSTVAHHGKTSVSSYGINSYSMDDLIAFKDFLKMTGEKGIEVYSPHVDDYQVMPIKNTEPLRFYDHRGLGWSMLHESFTQRVLKTKKRVYIRDDRCFEDDSIFRHLHHLCSKSAFLTSEEHDLVVNEQMTGLKEKISGADKDTSIVAYCMLTGHQIRIDPIDPPECLKYYSFAHYDDNSQIKSSIRDKLLDN